MESLTKPLYEVVDTVDPSESKNSMSHNRRSHNAANWRTYPGDRSVPLHGVTPPCSTVLLKTGGNALQAVDPRVLSQDNVVAVTVPPYGKPGQMILVRIPSGDPNNTLNEKLPCERWIRTQIPFGIHPGSVFMVQLLSHSSQAQLPLQAVYTGVPLLDESRPIPAAAATRPAASSVTQALWTESPESHDLDLEENVELTPPNTHGRNGTSNDDRSAEASFFL